MTCKYKVKIKDIQYNYKVQMTDIQSKYKFKVFCTGYDDSEIKEKIDAMYQAWPKVSGEGETITLNDTANTTMAIDLKGNTIQDGEPTPDAPVEIQVVTGDNTIKVEGKNLFDYKTPNINQITWTPTDNGGLFTSSTYWKNLGNKLELDTTKQYTFSFGARNSTNLYYYIKTYTDETYQIVKSTIVNDGTALSKTFTPDSKYVSIYFANSGIFKNVEIPNIQLEESSTKTEFEPYVSQSYPISLGNIELCKIENYKDRIYPLNGKWYLEKKIGKIVLDGSEDWHSYINVNNNLLTFRFKFADIKSANQIYLLSNYFKNVTYDDAANGEFKNRYNNYYNLEFVYTDITSVTDFKTWLSTHNTIVYYVLATPTTEEITDSTLISQLEEIKEAKSYSGQTNISQTNDDKPFILTATALKDLSSL